jgi:hypothetical protein
MSKPGKTTRWAFVAAFNIAAIALVLAGAELAARALAGGVQADEQLPMCEPDPVTVWRYRPNIALTYRTPEFEMAIRTDGDGLRSSATPGKTGPTVLFIGDSFTFGWGVDQQRRFSEVVGQALGDVRIVNAGHWMYAYDQQLVLLKELVARHRPAVVVQGFYWLHVRTLYNHRDVRDRDGALVAVEAPSLRVDDRGVLRFHSEWVDDPPLGSQVAALLARSLLNRDLRRQAATWVEYMRPGSTADAELWAESDRLVGETIAYLRSVGVAYLPFLIPTSVEVGGIGWSHVGWTEKAAPSGVDPALPARRLAAMFSKRGTTPIDLHEALRAGGGSTFYFPVDGHWTEQGHAAAGAALAPAVAQALGRHL